MYKNPFQDRPWLTETGAAASASSTTKGLKAVIAGGITGAIEILITYPTEYVKTHLQLDEKGDRKQHTGAGDCVKKTINRYGVLGLYRGMSILLYGTIPMFGVRFGAFELFKEHMQLPNGTLTHFGSFLCGLGAGIMEACVVTTPMETIKVKFIHDHRLPHPRYRGFLHELGTIVSEQGLGGIYKGLAATVIKQGSNQAIRFFIIEMLKDAYRRGDPDKVVPKPLTGFFGACAGAASVFGNNPIDVIKTRMQGLEAKLYKNTWDCIVQAYKQEGLKAFYKGTVPRLCRVCLDVSITFMVYDSVMDLFQKIWP